jgi:hypothetical protein
MPVPVSYPGVYIEEIPSGVRTITGVATSIAAFVGATPRGPVGTPTTIFSFADYQRIFGGLSLSSTVSYAVNDFYANGGTQAIIVRATNGAVAAVYELPTGAAAPNDALFLNAASPGTWGNNLTITVDANTKDPTNSKLFNLTIAETNGSVEVFRNVSADPTDPLYVVLVLQQGSLLVSAAKNSEGAFPNVAPKAATVNTPTTPGTDGSALTAGQVSGSALQATKGGIYGLDKADLFNILCIPPLTSSSDTPASVWQDAATYAIGLDNLPGQDIVLLVNANLIALAEKNSPDNSWILNQFPNHYVVLLNSPTASADQTTITLNVWSWGF